MTSIQPASEPQRTFDTGSEGAPQGWMPGVAPFSIEEGHSVLQDLPVIGMFYRIFTGKPVPAPVKIATSAVTSAIFGGPLGIVSSIVMGFAEELARMGPDMSRPAAPAGMSATGSEAGVQPVSPGTLPAGAYTTLATTLPDFLGGGAPRTAFALASYAATGYSNAG